MADPQAWLLLIYRVPSEPTRLRATVWRKLKALGAVYLQSSAAAFPATGPAERTLRALRKEIEEMGGQAMLLSSHMLAGESDAVAIFNAAREEEYGEIVARCEDFLTEIDTETAAEHFSYAELEENDEDLAKLRAWYAKVAARDLLGAQRSDEAAALLERCAVALEGFAGSVYAAEDAET